MPQSLIGISPDHTTDEMLSILQQERLKQDRCVIVTIVTSHQVVCGVLCEIVGKSLTVEENNRLIVIAASEVVAWSYSSPLGFQPHEEDSLAA